MGAYDNLLDWLDARANDAATLSFSELEAILRTELAPSAQRYAAFWSTGNHVGRLLRARGWRASLQPALSAVTFRRIETNERSPEIEISSPLGSSAAAVTVGAVDIVLVGCVKEKQAGRHRAEDLYNSPLFLGRRARARQAACPWFVLSAKYGLVRPNEVIDSYDLELGRLSRADRRAWSSRVLDCLIRTVGPISGKAVEIHAGSDYRNYGLVDGLRSRGASVSIPLQGVSIGPQLAWYRDQAAVGQSTNKKDPNASAENLVNDSKDAIAVKDVVHHITRGFSEGTWEGRDRPTPPPTWMLLPEFIAVALLRTKGAGPAQVRLFLTFVAALDRAREAHQLWTSAAQLFMQTPWVFDAAQVCSRTLSELRDALSVAGVSRRHIPDAAAWRLIAESLERTSAEHPVKIAIFEGCGEASAIYEALSAVRESGNSVFPFLSGPKVGVMWLRMLVAPGLAKIEHIESVPVAVDVQVRKVSEYLGVSTTDGLSLDDARPIIQADWESGADAAEGPPELRGTAAAIDPAVWFFGKWGCTFCERAGKRIPISVVCNRCRFESVSL